MPSVDVGGVSLFYEQKGVGDAVLFVHGIPTDYRAWAAQTGPFSAKYRTVSMSRRYSAPNARQGDLTDSTVENNAEDIRGLIETLGIAPVHLVGHSYGGFAAAVAAQRRPDLVRSLVLVEPAISTLLVADAESRAQMLSFLLRCPSVALAARRFQTRSLHPSLLALDAGDLDRAANLNVDGVQDSPGAMSKFPAEVRQMMMDNVRTIAELRTSFPRFKASDAARIPCKTLVVNGESSPLWLRRIGELLVRAVSGAEGATVSGARHFPHLENPEQFNSKVLDFLGKVV